MDGERGEIWCYTDRLSYPPGATVRLQVSSTAALLRAGDRTRRRRRNTGHEAKRHCRPLAGHARPMLGRRLRLGDDASRFQIGADWPSGAYRVTLTAEGRDGRPIRCHHLFIVRPERRPKARPRAAGRGDRHLDCLQHLGRIEPLSGHHRPESRPVCTTVSIERPLCRGFVVLPPDAPRVPLEISMPPRHGAALSAHGMGLCQRLFEEIRLVRLGKL